MPKRVFACSVSNTVFEGRWSLFAGSYIDALYHLLNGTGDWKWNQNNLNHNDQKQRTKTRKSLSESFCLRTSRLLLCPLNFVGDHRMKRTGADRHTVALRRENWSIVHENPGRWSHKAGGRYSQCSFCMKLSAVADPGFESRGGRGILRPQNW